MSTSLLIIAVKLLFGFVGDVFNYDINWTFLAIFSTISIAGIFLGSFLSTRVPADKLKISIGWFSLRPCLNMVLIRSVTNVTDYRPT